MIRILVIIWHFLSSGVFPPYIPLQVALFPFFGISLIGRIFIPKTQRLSRALQKCGPVFIKLGQSLSLKPYLVGSDVANSLTSLQDKVPYKMNFNPIQYLGKIYKTNPYEYFSEIDVNPVSNASLACVFKAKLIDGKQVAIKILRPDVEKIARQDLNNLLFFTRIAAKFNPYKSIDLIKIVKSVRQTTLNELDFINELKNLTLLRNNLIFDTEFRIPNAYEQLTRTNVLVLDWVDGMPLSRMDLIEKEGLNKTIIAKKILQFYCNQVYRDGVFHADMHPGNLFVDRSYNIIAIDCGNIGILPYKDRIAIAEIIYGFLRKNYERVADIYLEMGYVSKEINRPEMRYKFIEDLRKIGKNFVGSANDAKPIKISHLLTDLFNMTEKYGMETQEHLLMLQKTMLYVEAVVYNLDSKINVWEVIEKWMNKWAKSNLGISGYFSKIIDKCVDKMLTKLQKIIR